MDYHSEEGTNLIRTWYDAQDDRVRANFLYAVNEVASRNKLEDSPSFKRLKYRHVGLFEIRFEVIEKEKKRKFRPVGFWGLEQRQLILVNGCEKSGRFTVPPGVFDDALNIQLEYYLNGRGTIYENWF